MASIEFKNVCKRFGDVSVIEQLNLKIKNEEFMVLVGPSGCGKSTALRMIAGLEEITEGELYIGERLVNDVPPRDRDAAMVFQSYALYPHMTVGENISFGLRIRKMPKDEIQRLVKEAAQTLGLSELLDRKPKALSGGQRQRVALGRAIVRKPSVFLFDEPLSNLDAELRVQMRAELGKLQRRLKTTTVYVTHDQVEAMTMGHRIAVMRPLDKAKTGSLTQCGTPLDVYDRPQNIFTARFIGTPNMNLLSARISDDGSAIEHREFSTPVPEEFKQAAKEYRGKEVVLGIRPEHIGAPDEVDWDSTVPIKGQLEIMETVGHEIIVHVRCDDEIIIAKLGSHYRLPDYGQQIDLVLNCNHFHLFDPMTEKRLST